MALGSEFESPPPPYALFTITNIGLSYLFPPPVLLCSITFVCCIVVCCYYLPNDRNIVGNLKNDLAVIVEGQVVLLHVHTIRVESSLHARLYTQFSISPILKK